MEAILHTQIVKALKGDPRATQILFSFYRQAGGLEPEKQDEQPRGGILLIPDQMGVEEWRAREKARLAKQADERE